MSNWKIVRLDSCQNGQRTAEIEPVNGGVNAEVSISEQNGAVHVIPVATPKSSSVASTFAEIPVGKTVATLQVGDIISW